MKAPDPNNYPRQIDIAETEQMHDDCHQEATEAFARNWTDRPDTTETQTERLCRASERIAEALERVAYALELRRPL